MVCNKCGADMPKKAVFCPQCGVPIGRARSSQSANVAKIRPSGPPGTAHDVSEEELWSGAYSPKAMTGEFIAATFLLIAGSIVAFYFWPASLLAIGIGYIVVSVYLGILAAYRQMSVRYRLTNQRLLREMGILSRTDDRILVVDVDDIKVVQGIIERIFNVGTITLVTKDESTKDEDKHYENTRREDEGRLMMKGIENPRYVADLIDEARRAERSRRGVYTMNA